MLGNSVHWKYCEFQDLGNSVDWAYFKIQDLGNSVHWKYFKGQLGGLRALKVLWPDCIENAASESCNGASEAKKEGGRGVEGRVMQEKFSGN